MTVFLGHPVLYNNNITKATITAGYLVTPLLQSRYDCKDIMALFLLLTSLTMVAMGLSFTYPALSMLTIPSLVVGGLAYGLGLGPAPNILMSTLFSQGQCSPLPLVQVHRGSALIGPEFHSVVPVCNLMP